MNNSKISVCIITLCRESLYNTLEFVFQQEIEDEYEVICIAQGEVDLSYIKRLNVNHIPFSIFYYGYGLGFGYYRNQAILHSKGEILVWIDDDECPMNKMWISALIKPIKEKNFQVVTSGCTIKLGQGYWTDCISLFGYPGGGALGFDKMWDVDKNSVTRHLCSGNFAILKSIFQTTLFLTSLHGGEDNALATFLQKNSIGIFYEKRATVYHSARNLKSALGWWRIRAKSLCNGVKGGDVYEENIHYKIFKKIKLYLKPDKYFFGKCVLLCIQLGITAYYLARYSTSNKVL